MSFNIQSAAAMSVIIDSATSALADFLLALRSSPEGNTWLRKETDFIGANGLSDTGREALYAKLDAITGSAAYQALAGQLSLVRLADELGQATPGDLATRARSDFAVFAALYSGSPFLLKAGDPELIEATAALNWNDIYLDWQADRAISTNTQWRQAA